MKSGTGGDRGLWLVSSVTRERSHGGARRDCQSSAPTAQRLAVLELSLSQTNALRDDGFAAVRALLTERSATLGRRVHVDGVVGVARGIDDDGALQIEDDRGARVTVRAGDAWAALRSPT